MREESVKRFLSSLGVPVAKIKVSRHWTNAPCPFAQWTHGSGVDEHPSFGISISNDGRSTWFCFGCHPKASLLEGLLHDIFVATGEYPWEAADIFIRSENHGEGVVASIPDIWSDVQVDVAPIPKRVLRLFPLLQNSNDVDAIACKNYLIKRGVPIWVQNMYGVRYDPRMASLVFPLTDSSGRVFMLRERSIKEKKLWTVSKEYVEKFFHLDGLSESDFPRLTESGVWFGLHLIDWAKPVILVEGEIKVMRLAALGEFNSIGATTASVSASQIDAVPATIIYLGFDADKAGALAHHKIIERMKGRKVLLFELDWSLVGRKDPDELENKRELEIVMKGAKKI